MLDPALLVCDEPISALDVSVAAQVINLMQDLQTRFGMAYLFISHDLKVIRQIADEVAVMYLGRIVEQGAPDALFHAPAHPYTEALVSAVPTPLRGTQGRIILKGDPPNPVDRPSGCAFHPRCPRAAARCREEVPALRAAADGRLAACHLVAGGTGGRRGLNRHRHSHGHNMNRLEQPKRRPCRDRRLRRPAPPDLVTQELTPNIMRLAARGTWFRRARSVFPSVTRVATSSIAAGAPPIVHGIVGNAFYHREAIPDRMFDTGDAADIRPGRGRITTGACWRPIPSATSSPAAGKRMAVVHTGSAGSAHFINPRARANGHWTFSMHGAGATQTPEAVEQAIARFGPLPERELPRLRELAYGGRVMTEIVLPELRPDVALIWFNEPDTTFHYRGLGSPEAIAGLREADRAFGTILDWIEAQPDAERFAVIAASDHGQISTGSVEPLFETAREAGFDLSAARAVGGASLVATGGISGEIRLREGEYAGIERIAAWLMEHPAISHVFSCDRNGVEGEVAGTLSLKLMNTGHAERQPDLMFILKSTLDADQYGLPGLGAMTPGDVPLGGGMHGGINPHELNTVLILGEAGGEGTVSQEPAGIIDIGPTVLGLLGLQRAATMMGRNLAVPAREEAHELRPFGRPWCLHPACRCRRAGWAAFHSRRRAVAFDGFPRKHRVIPGLTRDPCRSASRFRHGSRISASLRPGWPMDVVRRQKGRLEAALCIFAILTEASRLGEAQIIRPQIHEIEGGRPPGDRLPDRIGLARLVEDRGRRLVIPDVEHLGEQRLALRRVGLGLQGRSGLVEGLRRGPELGDLDFAGRSPGDPERAERIGQARSSSTS